MNIENSRTKIGLIRTGGLEIMEETICSVKNINNAIFFDSTIHFNWFVGDSGIIYNYNQKVKIKQDTVIFIYTLKANDTFVIKDKFFSVFEFHLKRITIPLFHLVGKYCCISDSIEITRNEIVIKNNRFYGIKLIDTVLIFHDVIISGYYFSIEKINYLLYKDNNNKLVLFVVEPNLSMIYRKE